MFLGAELHYKLSTWTITTEVTTTVRRDSRTKPRRVTPMIPSTHRTTAAGSPKVWVERLLTSSRRKRRKSKPVRNRRIIMRSCRKPLCLTSPTNRESPLPS